MAENSNIEWTTHTFNPYRGCTKVSAGCKNCYAETLSGRNHKTLGTWGPKGERVIAAESYWRQPLKWDREAKEAGERRRVFCASLADVFEGPETMPKESWDSVQAARQRLFQIIMETPNLDWLLLTKRPENVPNMLLLLMNRAYGIPQKDSPFANWLERWAMGSKVPANVWIGASVENQVAANERIAHLLIIPAAVRFLSCEPLLGSVDIGLEDEAYVCPKCNAVNSHYEVGNPDDFGSMGCEWCGFISEIGVEFPVKSGIDWVIAGGESGPNARPMHPDWPRTLRDSCAVAGVPFLFKQWGEWALTDVTPGGDLGKDMRQGKVQIVKASGENDGHFRRGDVFMRKVGKKAAGRLLDGVEHNGYPEVAL